MSILLLLSIGLQLIQLGFIAWMIYYYFTIKKYIKYIYTYITMECDQLIDSLLSESAPTTEKPCTTTKDVASTTNEHKERLASLVAGGHSLQYLGKAYTVEQIESLSDENIDKLYARYEAKLGAAMTKSLGKAALQFYSEIARMFLPIPIEKQPALVADLEADPFVENALSSVTCELYHRYGMFLAPFTAVLTTMKYCEFKKECPLTYIIEKDGSHEDEKSKEAGSWKEGSGREESEKGEIIGAASGRKI